ncbi:MAG: four helix bundle protein [Bacteroidota bacterium]
MNTLQIRLVRFSVTVYQQIQGIKNDPLLSGIASQLVRSATSTGANYSEAQSASSGKDFHNKVRIALKELKESQYWICFLSESNVKVEHLQEMYRESEELVKILSTICKKTDPQSKK